MIYQKTIWGRVSRRSRCPICDAPDWCSVSSDGNVVFCMRTISEKPVETKHGLGYIHKLTGEMQEVAKRVCRRPAIAKRRQSICGDLSKRAQESIILANFVDLARTLGVSCDSLRRLHVGWYEEWHNDKHYSGWSFPMRSTRGETVGMRIRNGRAKFSAPGFTEGLFIPDGIPHRGGRLYIVEGPTDCAAMLDLGGHCIGRPNCSGGVDDLLSWGRKREVIIIADRDKDKIRPDGSKWNPGWDGAIDLAEKMVHSAKTLYVMKPIGAKDVREWSKKNPKLNEAAVFLVAKSQGAWPQQKKSE